MIKKSNLRMLWIICVSPLLILVVAFLMSLSEALVNSGWVAVSLSILMVLWLVLWLVVVMSQYEKFDILYGLYRRWKETSRVDEKTALATITLKDIYRLNGFKHERIKQIRGGEVADGFTFSQNNELGCVFYSHGKTHTFTYVVVVDQHHLITIPPMFHVSIYPRFFRVDTMSIRMLFSRWAEDNNYEIDHLLIYRGTAYDPDQMNFTIKIPKH
jgi:hypothetical protein